MSSKKVLVVCLGIFFLVSFGVIILSIGKKRVNVSQSKCDFTVRGVVSDCVLFEKDRLDFEKDGYSLLSNKYIARYVKLVRKDSRRKALVVELAIRNSQGKQVIQDFYLPLTKSGKIGVAFKSDKELMPDIFKRLEIDQTSWQKYFSLNREVVIDLQKVEISDNDKFKKSNVYDQAIGSLSYQCRGVTDSFISEMALRNVSPNYCLPVINSIEIFL